MEQELLREFHALGIKELQAVTQLHALPAHALPAAGLFRCFPVHFHIHTSHPLRQLYLTCGSIIAYRMSTSMFARMTVTEIKKNIPAMSG